MWFITEKKENKIMDKSIEKITIKELIKASDFIIIGKCPERMVYILGETDTLKLFEKVNLKKVNSIEHTIYVVRNEHVNNENYTHILTETEFEDSIPVCVESFYGDFFLTPKKTWMAIVRAVDDFIISI